MATVPPWKLKPLDDLKESDFSMYDDISEPYAFLHKDLVYKNKARKKLDEAIAEYRERSRNVDAFDAISPPPNSNLLGCVSPHPITGALRPRIIHLCNFALEKYNAENQGANFVFAELVKLTAGPVSGLMCYITFEAKDAAGPPNSATRTFQAKVWDKFRDDEKPVVKLCRMKPT